MRRDKRTQDAIVGAREAQRLAATLGGEIRAARRRRRMTIDDLGARVGLRQARVGAIERGEGAGAPLRVWVALGLAVGRPVSVALSRDIAAGQPADAGHLAVQELILRLARDAGLNAMFELPTRPATPARSIDVGIRDYRRRVLIAIEIWNRLDDLGAAIRAYDRKVAEAGALAVAIAGGMEPYRVASCWILRDTAANRRLVARYPAILSSRFPGSSLGWTRALTSHGPLPPDPGLLWASADARRLVPFRWHRSAQDIELRDSP
jgi:transcriptional regulator with XRE-family HTH domain